MAPENIVDKSFEDTTEINNQKRTQSMAVADTMDKIAELSDSEEMLLTLPFKSRDRYTFLRTIGFGGMKTVLLVRDTDTMREVAMAIMPDFRERSASDIRRFVQEARITAKLEHPNIVPVHDIGVDANGAPYFTMKYLRGKTLAIILRKLKERDPEFLAEYDSAKLLRIFTRICNAMAFAHSYGIIHLDLKPENIHVGEFGDVQVLDWGLSKLIGSNRKEEDAPTIQEEKFIDAMNLHKTVDGIAKGTPGYMAPEQAAGKNNQKDQRTDIYSLGCILYSILTFETPFSGQRVSEVLKATIKGHLTSPSQLTNPVRAIPVALEAICLKAMERQKENRYQSVYELRADIFAFSNGYATKAENAGNLKKTYLFISRNFIETLLVSLIILLLAIFGLVIYLFMNNIIIWDLQ